MPTPARPALLRFFGARVARHMITDGLPTDRTMAPISTPDDLDLQPTRVGKTIRSSVRSSMTGLDQASIMGAELVAAILTWGAIGWFIDERLGTGPWGIVVGALIGNAAGLYLIFLRGNRMEGYADLPSRRTGGHTDGR